MTQQWEYFRLDNGWGKDLNVWGREGWELVSIDRGTFMFKRLRSSYDSSLTEMLRV